MPDANRVYDVAIVGAGPTGLSCAIYARRAGLDHIVLEKGTLVNTIVGYPTDMTFFSTPDRLGIGGHPFTSANFRPNRREAIHYYRGVAEEENLNILLGRTVDRVQRIDNSLAIHTNEGQITARTAVIATGYFDHVNPMDVEGASLPHVKHYFKEPYDDYGQDVVVIGGRNSAVETALSLYRNGARVTMVHRRSELGKGVKYWIRPDIERRIEAGDIGMHWDSEVVRIAPDHVGIRQNRTGQISTVPCNTVYAMIGYRPDVRLLDACGVEYDTETLIPAYDPKTFESNVDGLFLAGSVVCGCKTWEVFIENGREHAQIVIEAIRAKTA